MEVEGNLDLANNALTRATTVFVKVWTLHTYYQHEKDVT
jgi:hypothetical protein